MPHLYLKTENLKKILDSLERKVSVNGGDHNASRMYLIVYKNYLILKQLRSILVYNEYSS